MLLLNIMKLTLIQNTILFFSGLFLLFSYYIFGKNMKNVNELWGNINKNTQIFYICSMIICASAFISLFFYLNLSNKLNKNNILYIFLSLLSIVLFSIYWMPLSIYYLLKKKMNEKGLCFLKLLILLTLFLVSLSSFFVVYELNKIIDESLLYSLAFYGMCYFLFHVTILDLGYWSYHFF